MKRSDDKYEPPGRHRLLIPILVLFAILTAGTGFAIGRFTSDRNSSPPPVTPHSTITLFQPIEWAGGLSLDMTRIRSEGSVTLSQQQETSIRQQMKRILDSLRPRHVAVILTFFHATLEDRALGRAAAIQVDNVIRDAFPKSVGGAIFTQFMDVGAPADEGLIDFWFYTYAE